jgi:Holliday junction resolvase RusA-like endonuclease
VEKIAMSENFLSITFTVPLVPPSVNHYVKHTRTGRSYVTAEAMEFKIAIAVYANHSTVSAKTFSVRLAVTLPKGARGDVDNFPKLCLDGLADCGMFLNRKGKRVSDAWVRHLEVDLDAETRPDEGRTVITVEALT